MDDLTKLNISEAREGLRNKQFSASELIKAQIKTLEDNKNLNLMIEETPELAMSAAKNTDTRIAKGEYLPMDGIPVAIKDLFCTRGVKTTAGSKILENFVPPYESFVTKKLWENGAVLIGKSNCDEFAMGSSNLTSFSGPTINPWKSSSDNSDFVPGGSSGGSAAAVASYVGMGATGTDTGGSIRQPASFCGIVGLKPTYGRCSRFGIVAFASSLDQAGPLTRSVRDSAIMLESMAGYDKNDSTSVNIPVPNYESFLNGNIKGLKVGIPKEYKLDGFSSEITKMWENGINWLKSEGAEIFNVSLPYTKYALPTYYILAPAEASSNLARYDGVRFGFRKSGKTLDELYENTRSIGFGEEVKRRIMIGTYVLSAGYYDAYYLKAQKVRALITNDFKEVFKKVDVLLTPTTPTAAFSIKNTPKDPISMYMNDILTVPINLAGLPAISIPAALSKDGLPLGLQLIGSAFNEQTILRVADVLEKSANFSSLKNNKGNYNE